MYYHKMKTPAPRQAPATTYEKYDGKELERTPGIPESRFRAFELPSLQGTKRVQPKSHN